MVRLWRWRDVRAVRVSHSLLLCRGIVATPKNYSMTRGWCGIAVPYLATTTVCGLSQADPYVCQEDRTPLRTVRCVLECVSFCPGAFYNTSRPGSGLRDSGLWLHVP